VAVSLVDHRQRCARDAGEVEQVHPGPDAPRCERVPGCIDAPMVEAGRGSRRSL
jgi:hypothetical protein